MKAPEKTIVEIPVYKMCKSQLAQIDCRTNGCIFHSEGCCINASPAITLNNNGFVC